MPIDADAASAAAAIGAALGRVRPTAWFDSWLQARNHRTVVRLHKRAITGAYAVGCSAPVYIEVEHEDRPKERRLHLRLHFAVSPMPTRGSDD